MRRLERESAERMRRLEKEFADKERFLDEKYSGESKGHRGTQWFYFKKYIYMCLDIASYFF